MIYLALAPFALIGVVAVVAAIHEALADLNRALGSLSVSARKAAP